MAKKIGKKNITAMEPDWISCRIPDYVGFKRDWPLAAMYRVLITNPVEISRPTRTRSKVKKRKE